MIVVSVCSTFFLFVCIQFSVWYGATVRGDVNTVEIGEKTSIGDRAVVHVARIQGDFPTFIGSNVTIAPGALVHAATLKDGVTVGEMAQVLDGAVVEENAHIAPGSVVTPGTHVSAGELWAGSPAKKVRALTELAQSQQLTEDTVHLAILHAVENSKDYKQIVEDELTAEEVEDDISDMLIHKPDYDVGDVLGQGHPGRIFRSVLSHPEEYFELKNKQMEEEFNKQKSSRAA
jgi:gamma-carbonic anhydrase